MKLFQRIAILFSAAVLVVFAHQAVAQVSIGTNGSGILAFASLPTTTSGWSTVTFGIAAGTFINASNLDTAVISSSLASAITTPLGSSPTVPPSQNAMARWNSAGQYLQTRNTANDYLLLMATLRNDTGSNVTQIRVRYDWDQKNPIPVNEDIPGHRSFFSLTGQQGTWTLIPSLSTFTTTSLAQVVTADIPTGTWTNGSSLYLLWADDNGPGGAVDPQEGAYTIDNFSVTAVVPTIPVVTSHPVSQSVAPGGHATLSVGLSGASPIFYQWFKDNIVLSAATNAALLISNAQLQDQGDYFVIASNQFGTAISSNAFLTVTCSTTVAILSQPVGRTTVEGASFSLGVSASGTFPIRYQWRRNGIPIDGQTNSTLLFSNAHYADSGFYSVVLQNCGGMDASTPVLVSVAEAPSILLHLTNHFWKYYDVGDFLGDAWRAPLYDDSWWLSGRGVFAFENNPAITPLTNTVLRLTNSPSVQSTIVYYFRAAFTFTNSPSEVLLVSSNYIDDGAVVYLNGSEAFRFNLPAGPLTAGTLASAANPLGEGIPIVSNLSAGLLLTGTNTVAVELRQNSATSADVVFGMQLIAVHLPPTLLSFIQQPQDTMTNEGGTISFAATVSGNNAQLQWFKNGTAVYGATRSTLTLSNVEVSDAGSYSLQASNVLGFVYSRFATLTVVPDQTSPVLIAADLIDSSHVLASFSEAVQVSTATNPSNYTVTNTVGTAVAVLNVAVTNETNVVLTTTAIGANQNYILTARGVADNGPKHNVSTGSAVPVARRWQLITFDGMWEFYDPFPQFGDPFPEEGWKTQGYDTSNWGSGAGAFSYSIDGQFIPPVAVHTVLSQTAAHSSYYRSSFSFPGSASGATLSLRSAVDDGAVFYLNGEELLRTNLPFRVISPQTPAVTAVGSAVLGSNVVLVPRSLHPGPNLFAAELHQAITDDGDKFFALELMARVESLVTGPILLLAGPKDATVREFAPATFTARIVAAETFQWLMNGTNLPGATNAILRIDSASLALDGTTFGVVAHGPGGTVQSSNATLRVVPDLEGPEFLAAMGTNNTLTLTFSEILDRASAENSANYMVTNSSGAILAIQDVTLLDGTNVVLQFSSLSFGRYGVVVNNVRDASMTGNLIRPNSAVLSGFSGLLLPVDSSWRYYQAVGGPGMNWQRGDFDDSGWLSGRALFHVTRGTIFTPLPEPVHTMLMLSNSMNSTQIVTYYFRMDVLSAGSGNAALSIRYLLDDGLILYLNGAELYRRRMPAGPVSYSTLANGSVGDVTYEGPFVVQATNIAIGTNLFAAEVHQATANGADVGFALEVRATMASERIFGSEPAVPPTLRLLKWAQQYVLAWDDPSALLESSDNVQGPWSAVNQSNPVFVSATNSAAFYRLRR